MTAPFVKTADEARQNIKRVEHKTANGAPIIGGTGSSGNTNWGSTKHVTSKTVEDTYVTKRKI